MSSQDNNQRSPSGNASVGGNANLPVRWKDCVKIYPPFKEIAAALQDIGKQVASRSAAGKRQGLKLTQYDKVAKLSAHIYRKIKDLYKPKGLGDNVSRGKIALMNDIINYRKAVDVAEVRIEFHPFAKDAKVFLINNEVPFAGVDQSVERFQNHIEETVKAKMTQRTPDDGMRCVAILLDPEFRGSVSGIMSNKKDRTKSDVPGDPTLSFFEKAVESFLDVCFIVKGPREEFMERFPEEDKICWDPNSPNIMEHNRDGKWLMETWFGYVKPKYRKALTKWNKETGGGDGEVTSFIDFAGSDRWLGWVFALDYEAHFLLANNASGQMPRHLQLEAGWDNMSDIDENSSKCTSTKTGSNSNNNSSSSKGLASREKNLNDLTDQVKELIQIKKQSSTTSTLCPETPERPSVAFCIDKAAYYRKEINNIEQDSDISPETKEYTLSMLKRKKKRLYEMAKEADEAKAKKKRSTTSET